MPGDIKCCVSDIYIYIQTVLFREWKKETSYIYDKDSGEWSAMNDRTILRVRRSS